jgi:hypothetical protein
LNSGKIWKIQKDIAEKQWICMYKGGRRRRRRMSGRKMKGRRWKEGAGSLPEGGRGKA